MDAGISAAHKARSQHRHELRTLTYVTLDQANGGVVRNLSRCGIGVQAVAAVRPKQQIRVRFELRYPRLRVEARGEVVWATFSGQCGIRFLDLSPRASRQIDEWVFGDLLEGASLHNDAGELNFAEEPACATADGAEKDNGLILSAAPRKVIELPVRSEEAEPVAEAEPGSSQLDWLSQPLSGRSLAWTVNVLVVFAALLLFVLVFLSVTREAPRWPLEMMAGAALLVAAMYWGFFQVFGGGSLGQRLARMAGSTGEGEEENRDARFR